MGRLWEKTCFNDGARRGSHPGTDSHGHKRGLLTEKEILGVAVARSSVLLFVMWAGGERHWAGDLFFSSVGVRNYRK